RGRRNLKPEMFSSPPNMRGFAGKFLEQTLGSFRKRMRNRREDFEYSDHLRLGVEVRQFIGLFIEDRHNHHGTEPEAWRGGGILAGIRLDIVAQLGCALVNTGRGKTVANIDG